jgi:hypothetical protein
MTDSQKTTIDKSNKLLNKHEMRNLTAIDSLNNTNTDLYEVESRFNDDNANFLPREHKIP